MIYTFDNYSKFHPTQLVFNPYKHKPSSFELIVDIVSKENPSNELRYSMTPDEVLELRDVLDSIIKKHRIRPQQPPLNVEEAEIVD